MLNMLRLDHRAEQSDHFNSVQVSITMPWQWGTALNLALCPVSLPERRKWPWVSDQWHVSFLPNFTKAQYFPQEGICISDNWPWKIVACNSNQSGNTAETNISTQEKAELEGWAWEYLEAESHKPFRLTSERKPQFLRLSNGYCSLMDGKWACSSSDQASSRPRVERLGAMQKVWPRRGKATSDRKHFLPYVKKQPQEAESRDGTV